MRKALRSIAYTGVRDQERGVSVSVKKGKRDVKRVQREEPERGVRGGAEEEEEPP